MWWQSESLIRRTIVDRFSECVIDRWMNVYVDRWWSPAVDRSWILGFVFILMIAVACCNESGVNPSVGRLWPHNSDRIMVTSGFISVRHSWFVCMLQTAPTVAMKALPRSREWFLFWLFSRTWKSTGISAFPICTSRSLMIPPEFLVEWSTKLNESCEGSIFRPRCYAITLGRMLSDVPVSHNAHGN